MHHVDHHRDPLNVHLDPDERAAYVGWRDQLLAENRVAAEQADVGIAGIENVMDGLSTHRLTPLQHYLQSGQVNRRSFSHESF